MMFISSFNEHVFMKLFASQKKAIARLKPGTPTSRVKFHMNSVSS